MINTSMNYGLGTPSFSGSNDILSSAYSNPMTTCSANGWINVNGAQLPTNYDNDFLMPQELQIGNLLNGTQGAAQQTGDQFTSTQDAQAQTQEQSGSLLGGSLKKKGAVAGFLAPIAIGAYKVFKGAAASKVFNKELFVKCPMLAVAGFAAGALIDKFFN